MINETLKNQNLAYIVLLKPDGSYIDGNSKKFSALLNEWLNKLTTQYDDFIKSRGGEIVINEIKIKNSMRQIKIILCLLFIASAIVNGQEVITYKANYELMNDGYISSINDRSIKYSIEKSDKKAKWVYRLIRIHNKSVMINEDAKISIKIDHDAYLPQKAGIFVDIENNTDELLFLDLGTCFFRKNNRAISYFLNTSTTTTSGYASGWSFGTSTIGNILGLNGSVFNRTSFGGGVFNSKSTTVYAERILAVVPHTKYTLPLKIFYETKGEKPYRTDFKLGERSTYQQPEKIEDSPWEIILSYAKESDLDKMKRMRVAMYVAEELSVPSLWKDGIENETEEAPLHYYYRVK